MTMLNLIYFLETSQEETYSKGWYIGMIILIALLMMPWIYIIFRYGFFRRLRVRFIIDENEELDPIYLKRGQLIVPKEAPVKENKEFVGWYMDKELTSKFTPHPIDDENIKLYAKYIDK